MILGLDEAGRGPVIGPLVLCGLWVEPRGERRLVELGVRDSKAFGSSAAGQARRASLSAAIREVASHLVLFVVEAAEVDRRVWRGELNALERELATAAIESGPRAERIIADGRRLFGPLAARFPELEARDRADSSNPVVAAASIVAKAERDARFAAITAPLGEVLGPIRGGGYVNAATAAFLRAHLARFGRLPDDVRRSWSWSLLRELLPRDAGGPQAGLFGAGAPREERTPP